MNLKKIFEPNTVAVVGVSLSNPFHPANVIYNKNNLRFKSNTYCVNTNGGTLYGQKVYRSISEIPEKINLAVLSVRAEYTPEVMLECVKSGVSGAVIVSGGFAESGRADLQNEVARISKENNFPVIGPNCLGVYSPPNIDTFFLPPERLITPRRGHVALISQSGGILVDLAIKLTEEGVGLSRAVSIGNKAVIDEVELLKFFNKDDRTRVIGIYLEGFDAERGRIFIEEVNKSSKPVVILKSGKTPGGAKAVSSHTAAMAGDYFVFREVLKASRAVEAENESEFVSFCEGFSRYTKSDIKNVCIITASGGHGAIASDGCYNIGLNTVQIPDNDIKELIPLLSKSIHNIASFNNPIDLTGSAVDNDFVNATKYFLGKDYVDCIIFLLLPYIPGVTSDIGSRIAQVSREYDKPIITYMPHIDKYGIFIDGFESNNIPVAHTVEGAVYMVKGLARRGK